MRVGRTTAEDDGGQNMTKRNVTEDLYDPRSGGQAIRIESLHLGETPVEPARINYFGVYIIERFLVFTMSFVTLSFLLTMPECWVPALGDTQLGWVVFRSVSRTAPTMVCKFR